MLDIARNDHIVIPCLNTNATAAHKAVSIASTLSAIAFSLLLVFFCYTRSRSLLVGAESVVR